jgi:hypothetical protein
MPKKIATGSIFRKSYKDRNGRTRKSKTWFLKFYSNGEPVEDSTGTSDYDEALGLLREKMAAANKKSYAYTEDPDRVTVNQLLISCSISSSKITGITNGLALTIRRKESTSISSPFRPKESTRHRHQTPERISTQARRSRRCGGHN